MTQWKCVLAAILNCGIADLELLEDINYDLDDVIDELMDNHDLTLNSIFRTVFMMGAQELSEKLNMYKDELEATIKETIKIAKREASNTGYPLTDDEMMEYDEYRVLINDLELLNSGELKPEDDLNYFLNFCDTHVL